MPTEEKLKFVQKFGHKCCENYQIKKKTGFVIKICTYSSTTYTNK